MRTLFGAVRGITVGLWGCTSDAGVFRRGLFGSNSSERGHASHDSVVGVSKFSQQESTFLHISTVELYCRDRNPPPEQIPATMTEQFESRLNVETEPIILGPVSVLPFIPGSGNVFPKYVDAITQTAWELWFFDGISADKAAIVVGFGRNMEGPRQAPFRCQVLCIWPDESTWHRDMYFSDSIVTTVGDAGDVVGVWKDPIKNMSASFQVPVDSSWAKLTFAIPGVLEGNVSLTSMPGDTGLNTRPELGSSVNYMRPIGRASVTADLEFYPPESNTSKSLVWPMEGGATGGMDRVWSPLSWGQVMTESYYLRAHVGTYAMQIMRIFSDMKSGNQPHTVARLYRDGKLICATQDVVDETDGEVPGDSLVLSKVLGAPNDAGLTGAFRDKNSGYTVHFIQGGPTGQRWTFDVRHERTFWNLPTSAPGPNATGNTGFIESLEGGSQGESFNGVGTGGQCQLS